MNDTPFHQGILGSKYKEWDRSQIQYVNTIVGTEVTLVNCGPLMHSRRKYLDKQGNLKFAEQ